MGKFPYSFRSRTSQDPKLDAALASNFAKAVTADEIIRTKAGAPTDADFPHTPPDGTRVLDTTNHRVYYRSAGVWKYAALT